MNLMNAICPVITCENPEKFNRIRYLHSFGTARNEFEIRLTIRGASAGEGHDG